jgi:hypothetical protein
MRKRRLRFRSPSIDQVTLKPFIVDDSFKKAVMGEVFNPELHYIGKPAEVCGALDIVWREDSQAYVLIHNLESSHPEKRTKDGFHKGDLEDNGVQFCHPKKYVHNVLWHTHPRGVPAYPSGSDVFITVINDCTGGLSEDETTAQTFVEFLFTEYGFWVIHRNVYANNIISSALDYTESRGNSIRMKNRKMFNVVKLREYVDQIIGMLEKRIVDNYYRTEIPDEKAVRDIQNTIDKDPTYTLIKNRIRVNFYSWETDKIYLPEVLITTPVSGICIAR